MNIAAISMKQLDELIAGGSAGYFFPFFYFFPPEKMLCLKETSFYERLGSYLQNQNRTQI